MPGFHRQISLRQARGISRLADLRGWTYHSRLPISRLDAIVAPTDLPKNVYLRGIKAVEFVAQDETFYVLEVNDPFEQAWVVVSILLHNPPSGRIALPKGWKSQDEYCSLIRKGVLCATDVEPLMIQACEIAEKIQEQGSETTPSPLASAQGERHLKLNH